MDDSKADDYYVTSSAAQDNRDVAQLVDDAKDAIAEAFQLYNVLRERRRISAASTESQKAALLRERPRDELPAYVRAIPDSIRMAFLEGLRQHGKRFVKGDSSCTWTYHLYVRAIITHKQ